jgi:hypothetical protein
MCPSALWSDFSEAMELHFGVFPIGFQLLLAFMTGKLQRHPLTYHVDRVIIIDIRAMQIANTRDDQGSINFKPRGM